MGRLTFSTDILVFVGAKIFYVTVNRRREQKWGVMSKEDREHYLVSFLYFEQKWMCANEFMSRLRQQTRATRGWISGLPIELRQTDPSR